MIIGKNRVDCTVPIYVGPLLTRLCALQTGSHLFDLFGLFFCNSLSTTTCSPQGIISMLLPHSLLLSEMREQWISGRFRGSKTILSYWKRLDMNVKGTFLVPSLWPSESPYQRHGTQTAPRIGHRSCCLCRSPRSPCCGKESSEESPAGSWWM